MILDLAHKSLIEGRIMQLQCKWLRHTVATAGFLALSACGAAPGAGAGNEAATPAGPSDYLRPPEIVSARRAPDGGVVLAGKAVADAIVRAAAPDGGSMGVNAGPDGGWSLSMPQSNDARVLALSEEVAGRAVPANGAVVVLPSPYAPAVQLRAGGGSAVIRDPVKKPLILALDFDGGGGAVVTGIAPPGAAVRLDLDDKAADEGRANSLGRFSLAAVMSPGAHNLRVSTSEGVAEAQVAVSAAKPLTGQLFRAEHVSGAWRIDWPPPGGGLQSTLVLDTPGGG
jgi:hypothetical protein